MNKLEQLKEEACNSESRWTYGLLSAWLSRAYALGRESLDYVAEAERFCTVNTVVTHRDCILTFARHLNSLKPQEITEKPSTLTAGKKPVDYADHSHYHCWDKDGKCNNTDHLTCCLCGKPNPNKRPTPPVATPAPVEELVLPHEPSDGGALVRDHIIKDKLNELIRAHNALVARTNEH